MDFITAVVLLVISAGLGIYAIATDDVLLFAIASVAAVIAVSELRDMWDVREAGECE